MYLRRGRAWLLALLLPLAVLFHGAAGARTVLELDVAHQPVQLADWGDWWLDTTGAAGPAEVDAGRGVSWLPTSSRMVYPLTTGQALWVRLTIPPAPDAERWYLEIPYPSLNRATLFTLDSAGNWDGVAAGDLIAVEQWPVPHRHPLLPLQVSAEEPRRFLLKIENPQNFGAPLQFVSESHVSRTGQRSSLILGIYFGLAGLAAMISLLSAVSLRDSAYGLYGVSVTLMALVQATVTGIAGLHLWPHSPRWNDVAPFALSLLAAASLLYFLSAVVSLAERSLRAHRLLMAVVVLGALSAALVTVAEPSARFRIMVPYLLIAMAIGTGTLFWARYRGDRYGTLILLGLLPMLFMQLFPLARAAGLIPVSFLTTHGMQIGVALELPIVMVILLLRSQQRRENNRRIQGLDRMDPATGLINETVFAERLSRMAARSQRLRHQGAVLIIDIVNIEQIQRDFDRRSAQELPLRVAGRLLSAAREIDSVARLGDLRFGMLVEGPLTPEEAADAGPRLVARCLMPFKDKPAEWVAQVRVAQAVVPLDGTDAATLLRDMEKVLAKAPRDGRRAVFPLRG
ncbi:MAG: 7TM diverse intracellular signaling domain-containing protein [Burkholderiaceae bacterium]